MLNNRMPSFCIVMPYHISQNCGGGAEVQAWFLAKMLAQRGFDTHYICQSVEEGKSTTVEISGGVTIHWLKKSGRFQWIDSNKYYRALDKINPDIVVQRMSSCVTGNIGDYCKKNKKKFVWICTDNDTPQQRMHMKKQKKIHLSNNISYLKQIVFYGSAWINDFYRDRGMRHVTHAFTQNNFQKIKLKKYFNLISNRIISGHEIPKMILSSKERINNKLVIWAANLGDNKNPEAFVQLAFLLRNTPLTFVMIGGHSSQVRINKIFKSNSGNLLWTNKLSFDDTLGWFDKASFFINTSQKEGFPNTFIQAWLRGTPTLTLGVDPDSVILTHQLGIVCSDVEDMADKLKHLINTPEYYENISTNAIKYANENHTIERMTDNFLDVVLAKKGDRY